MFRDRTLQICLGLALILASPTFLPFSSRAAGQDNTKSGMKEMTKVVAHIPLPGSAVRQIFFQEENGKRYLYLQQNVHFTVVDVTDPDKPQIVDRVEPGGKLTEVGARARHRGFIGSVGRRHSADADRKANGYERSKKSAHSEDVYGRDQHVFRRRTTLDLPGEQ